MFCRNCGKELIGTPEICVNCGARPSAGNSFCHNCGATVTPLTEICVKCGARVAAVVSQVAAPAAATALASTASKSGKSTQRTALIIIGTILQYIEIFSELAGSSNDVTTILGWVGVGLTLWGCYLWTSLKNRSWAFMLWGLLSPIGLLGISLIKDKS